MATETQSLENTNPPVYKTGRVDLMVGKTPLRRLKSMGQGRCPIFIKMENLNPSGSIRDRYIAEIVLRAMDAQSIQVGDEICLAGLNDSAVSASYVASKLGLRCTVFTPESSSKRLLETFEAFGGKIVWTSAAAGLQGAIKEAAKWARDGIDRLYVDGYRRQAVKDSYRYLAMEIIESLEDTPLGGFTTSVTTGATFREVSRALRQMQANLEVRGAKLEENEFATAEENPYISSVNLAQLWEIRDEISEKEGILLGPKGAACVQIALDLEAELAPGRSIVALNPDSGQRYIGWEDSELFRANTFA